MVSHIILVWQLIIFQVWLIEHEVDVLDVDRFCLVSDGIEITESFPWCCFGDF
jgi:hypothetical protein